MKSHVINYIELPLKAFAEQFPELMELLPPVISVTDPNYIVRLRDGTIEVGYPTDGSWQLKD